MPNSNQFYINLLKNNPKQLVLSLQPLINSIVFKFIKLGKFSHDDHQEIKQQVNEALLNRMPKIRNQYHGKSLLTTYFTSVIRNICHDICRKNISTPIFLHYEYKSQAYENNNGDSSILFEEEKIRLQRVLRLYYREKCKVILCLKLKYRMLFTFDDFKNVLHFFDHKDYERFKNKIHPYISSTDRSVLTALTEIFNKYENKKNSADALRKWISKKNFEIIDILNETSVSSQYSEETLQILFEMCYTDEKECTSKIF